MVEVQQLMDCESREQALELLTALKLNKVELLNLAKSLNVYYLSGDSKERIANWIIEATVGSRIRSRAIANIRLNQPARGAPDGNRPKR